MHIELDLNDHELSTIRQALHAYTMMNGGFDPGRAALTKLSAAVERARASSDSGRLEHAKELLLRWREGKINDPELVTLMQAVSYLPASDLYGLLTRNERSVYKQMLLDGRIA